MSENENENVIVLKNVRVSFPALFKKAKFNGVEQNFRCSFLLSKNDVETKKEIDAKILNALKQAKIKVPKDKLFIKDGDDTDYENDKNCWVITASNQRRPVVVDRDNSVLEEEDGKIYGGCYVNAIISFWIQNNSYGKRVNANLNGVQFVKDGEAFGAKIVDPLKFFTPISEEEGEEETEAEVEIEDYFV